MFKPVIFVVQQGDARAIRADPGCVFIRPPGNGNDTGMRQAAGPGQVGIISVVFKFGGFEVYFIEPSTPCAQPQDLRPVLENHLYPVMAQAVGV